MSFKNWFLKNFVCSTIFSKGHIPIKEVRETPTSITQYKCKRCDCTLGMGHLKGFRAICPPSSNEIQIKEWNEFYDRKEQALREGNTDFPYPENMS